MAAAPNGEVVFVSMGKGTLRIVSNFSGMAKVIPAECRYRHEYLGDSSGVSGAWRLIRDCFQSDLIILNIDQQKLMLAGFVRWLFRLRFKLVSVDLILRPPTSRTASLKALFKKLLFSQVDQFLLYFKNIEGYQRFYGIGPDRALYIPFKVNGWEIINASIREAESGEYVLCSGRTLRDIETFVKAMRSVSCPGVLLQQKRELLEAHGTSSWCGDLPPNVRLIIDEGDSLETYIDFILKARLIVIPRYKKDIAPTGISTYLVAMALNKCVLVSEGPGADDVLTDQAVMVPPENPSKLAEQIDLLWRDDRLRSEIASRGRRYAHSLGGEDRLLSDVLRLSLLTLENGVCSDGGEALTTYKG